MKAIVTGSYDPITLGHVEIIKKAALLYDEIFVVAFLNEKKEYLFTLEEKKAIMKASLENISNVTIDTFDGLTADYMHKHGISIIIRGIRNEEDELYELDLANKMRAFDSSFQTIFIPSDEKYRNISSSLVREKIKSGESIKGLVSPKAEEKIKEILTN